MSQSNAAPTASSPPPTVNKGRIPLVLTPVHYDLWYQRFCLETFRFEGVVTIRCHRHRCDDNNNNKEEPFRSVAIHAADLQLTKAEIRVGKRGNDNDEEEVASTGGGIVYRAVEFRHNIKEQVCEICFDRPIKEEDPIQEDEGNSSSSSSSSQEYLLTIHFTGCLNDQMRGLYRSSYESLDSTKKKKWILTTQMEPTDARRAFPCFDEPALKATFALKCTVPYQMQCLSNTPLLSSHTHTTTTTTTGPASLVKTVTFQTTPKMSTYLVALIVGQFDSISQASNHEKDGPGQRTGTTNAVTTTVYTVPGKAHQAEFCLDTAAQCLQLFQELFQIPYPLPKSDLVAIPDFAAGYELHCVDCEWFSHQGK
jgi:aminopeptidase N